MTTPGVIVPKRIITAEDLLRWDAQGYRVEVVNGEIVPARLAKVLDWEATAMTAGVLHVAIISNIYRLLDAFACANNLGKVYPEGLHFILSTEAEGVRGARTPDVCFIRRGRFPPGFDLNCPFPGAPDLAVEVVSPTESQKEVAAKVEDYLAAGTEQVWVVYPDFRQVYQYRREDPSTIRIYKGEERIEAEALFPGLEIITEAFFVIEGFD